MNKYVLIFLIIYFSSCAVVQIKHIKEWEENYKKGYTDGYQARINYEHGK